MEKNNNRSSFVRSIEEISNHYIDLQKYAFHLETPKQRAFKKWLSSYIQKDEPIPQAFLLRFARWYFDKVFALFATPLRVENVGSQINFPRFYLAILSVLIYLVSLFTSFFLLFTRTNFVQFSSPSKSSSILDLITLLTTIAFILLLVPANYVRLYYLLTNKPRTRHHPLILGCFFFFLIPVLYFSLLPINTVSGFNLKETVETV